MIPRATGLQEPTREEYAALDAIMAAYMACNAADTPLAWERTPGVSPNPTAMGYLATAGRAAWRELMPSDAMVDLWSVMLDGASSAEYVWNLWANNAL